MENKNINLLKKTKDTGCLKYKNLISCFNKILLYRKFYDFNLLFKDNVSRVEIDTNKVNQYFNDNCYSFLDLMFFFVAFCKTQHIGVINFLLSDHYYFGQYDKKKYSVDDLNGFHFNSNCDTKIRNRKIFTFSFLSLCKDYFNIYHKEESNRSDKERLVVNLFENILLNNNLSIKNFRDIIEVKFFKSRTVKSILNNIFKKECYEEYLSQVSQLKEQILNYYNKCMLDDAINGRDKKDKIKYFVNSCDSSNLSFGLKKHSKSCFTPRNLEFDLTTNTYIYNNRLGSQQGFYLNLNNAFNDLDGLDKINKRTNHNTSILLKK